MTLTPLHVFNRSAPMARPLASAEQETPMAVALRAVLAHPIAFVTAVWLAAYVAIAFLA